MYEHQLDPRQVWGLIKAYKAEADAEIAKANDSATESDRYRVEANDRCRDLEKLLSKTAPSKLKKYKQLDRLWGEKLEEARQELGL